jgi:transcriptional regulator with XRE-family HTH domain
MNGISERLKHLRGSLSQQKFAEHIGLKQTTYGQYERGVTSPSTETASMICQKLGLNPRWLILGEEPMYDAEAAQERPRMKGKDLRQFKSIEELPIKEWRDTANKVAHATQTWKQRWLELPTWAKEEFHELVENTDFIVRQLDEAKALAVNIDESWKKQMDAAVAVLKAKDEAIEAKDEALRAKDEVIESLRALLKKDNDGNAEKKEPSINDRPMTPIMQKYTDR